MGNMVFAGFSVSVRVRDHPGMAPGDENRRPISLDFIGISPLFPYLY